MSTEDTPMLPLYQGMMATFFDHRAADVVKSQTAGKRQNQPRYLTDTERENPQRLAIPRYWVSEAEMPDVPDWFIGFSDVTSATNERTMEAYPLPKVAVGHKTPLIFSSETSSSYATLLAMLSSYVLDYVARQKVGGTSMTFFYVRQFPVISPAAFDRPTPWAPDKTLTKWIADRVVVLAYTAVDMEKLARSLDYQSSAFRWDQSERAIIRAELDAAFFHLYGIERDDVDYIMDTFPIVRRKDEAEFGEYRTKRLILENYDAMAAAMAGANE